MTCLLQLRFVLAQVLLQLLERLLLHAGTARQAPCVPVSRLCAVATAGAACLQVTTQKHKRAMFVAWPRLPGRGDPDTRRVGRGAK